MQFTQLEYFYICTQCFAKICIYPEHSSQCTSQSLCDGTRNSRTKFLHEKTVLF